MIHKEQWWLGAISQRQVQKFASKCENGWLCWWPPSTPFWCWSSTWPLLSTLCKWSVRWGLNLQRGARLGAVKKRGIFAPLWAWTQPTWFSGHSSCLKKIAAWEAHDVAEESDRSTWVHVVGWTVQHMSISNCKQTFKGNWCKVDQEDNKTVMWAFVSAFKTNLSPPKNASYPNSQWQTGTGAHVLISHAHEYLCTILMRRLLSINMNMATSQLQGGVRTCATPVWLLSLTSALRNYFSIEL